MPKPRVAPWLAFVCVMASASIARAQPSLGSLGPVVSGIEAGARVARFEAFVDCESEGDDEVRCATLERYVVERADDAPDPVRLAIVSPGEVRVDGSEVSVTEDVRRVFEVRFDGRAQAVIEVHGVHVFERPTRQRERIRDCIGEVHGACSGSIVRHPWTVRDSWSPLWSIEIAIRPPRLPTVETGDVHVREPDGWLEPSAPGTEIDDRADAPTDAPGGPYESHRHRLGRDPIVVAMREPIPPGELDSLVEPGVGPFVGFGRARRDGFRARLGLDLVLLRDPYFNVAFSTDTDFDAKHAVAITAEVASGSLLIFPSVGVGLGVPIEIRPETRSGLRTQITATFPGVGFEGSLDWFPRDRDTRLTLLGRVGF